MRETQLNTNSYTILTRAAAPPGTIDFMYIPISLACFFLELHLPCTITPRLAIPLLREMSNTMRDFPTLETRGRGSVEFSSLN